MANKYVDVSATFNGDGTTKDQATVDGGVGAWNSFLEAFKGTVTYGSINAGDKIYVRSMASSVNLGETLAVSTSSTTVGAEFSPVTFIIDSGVIWVGDDGVFELTNSTTSSYSLTLKDYCNIRAKYQGFRFNSNATNANGFTVVILENSVFDGLHMYTAVTTSNCSCALGTTAGRRSIYKNTYLNVNSHYYNITYRNDITLSQYTMTEFENLTIDFTDNPRRGVGEHRIFGNPAYGGSIKIRGIQVVNGWPSLELMSPLSKSLGGTVDITSISADNDTQILPTSLIASAQEGALGSTTLRIQGINQWSADTIYFDFLGEQLFEENGNYPTLNATLPSGQPWSYKIIPAYGVGETKPFKLMDFNKFCVLADGVRTASVELLLSEGYTSPQKDGWIVLLSYVDEDGIFRMETSADSGDLSTSTAGWSSTYYGAKNYNKYKIEYTTNYPVRVNTMIKLTVIMACQRASADDFFFVCPDFGLV